MKKDEMPEKIGKYEVIRKLGKGATASVYLGRDPDSDLTVAIKLIEFDSRGTALRRRLEKLFKTEIDVARRLDHPNIVRVHDAVIDEAHAYIVMEFVDGTPLDSYAAPDRLLPMDRVIGIAFKCALALDHAAQRGVVHRDIKPANILVDADDNPKITDFGLALFLQKDMEKDSTFVMGVGSPAYMSPEQVKGYPLNHKTDLYSLGVVLFQLLTGRLPYRAPNQAALIYKIINAEIPDITKLNPQLPAEFDRIMHRVLEKDTYTRYKSGADFAKDLTAVRYGIVGDNDDSGERDHKRFNVLRRITFFKEFDDLELWEALRLCVWRDMETKVTLMQEGEADKRFHIIVSGLVEVSTSGKALCRLGAGEVVGEMAYLHPDQPLRNATVVTLEPTTVVEFNAAALNLASEELQQAFHNVLLATVLNRLRAANAALAKYGDIAVIGSPLHRGELELAPPIDL
jgi:non-specific serine/threonine protein kinase